MGMPWDQNLQSEGEGPPTVCREEECSFCPRFAELDAEISKTHLILAELSRKRGELKTQINYHHIPYINRLPFELISQIFIDIVQEHRSVDPLERYYYFRDFSIPPLLGAVCKMWREVTLATPQLWTTVKFTVQFCACQSPDKIDVAREWFRRSRSLPLTIKIRFMDCQKKMCHLKHSKNYDFDSPVDLLRSHSIRWSRINIDKGSSQPQLLHKLLENLPNQPTDLEYLSLGSCSGESGTFDKKNVLLPRSIYQCDSRLGIVGLWDIPCGFERLTRMDMSYVPIDEVFYFFHNAPNLQDCRVTFNNDIDLNNPAMSFPLPTTPIVAQHLTNLTSGPSEYGFFCYLTLPSLQVLDCESYEITDDDDLNDLLACLKRSHPPLQTFKLTVSLNSPDFDDWHKLPPDLTFLKISMCDELTYLPESPLQCTVTENFLAALATPSGTLALPKLQSLRLTTRGMSDASWASLCDIFTTGSPDRLRLLKEIRIHQMESKWKRNFAMEARVFEVFEGLKDAGVRLEVKFNSFGPEFGSSSTVL